MFRYIVIYVLCFIDISSTNLLINHPHESIKINDSFIIRLDTCSRIFCNIDSALKFFDSVYKKTIPDKYGGREIIPCVLGTPIYDTVWINRIQLCPFRNPLEQLEGELH